MLCESGWNRAPRRLFRAFSSEVDAGSHRDQVYADCVDLSAVENASKQEPGAAHLKEDVMPTVSPQILPILMLFASNVFMTFAWYGHLKFKAHPLPLVIMASWGIA